MVCTVELKQEYKNITGRIFFWTLSGQQKPKNSVMCCFTQTGRIARQILTHTTVSSLSSRLWSDTWLGKSLTWNVSFLSCILPYFTIFSMQMLNNLCFNMIDYTVANLAIVFSTILHMFNMQAVIKNTIRYCLNKDFNCNRWRDTATAGSFRCSGNSTTGGLLDSANTIRPWVRGFI